VLHRPVLSAHRLERLDSCKNLDSIRPRTGGRFELLGHQLAAAAAAEEENGHLDHRKHEDDQPHQRAGDEKEDQVQRDEGAIDQSGERARSEQLPDRGRAVEPRH
jgi:hypothetical protein